MITLSPDAMLVIDYLKIGTCWYAFLLIWITIGGDKSSLKSKVRGMIINIIGWPIMMTITVVLFVIGAIEIVKNNRTVD